jgi:DNA primase catalytic core
MRDRLKGVKTLHVAGILDEFDKDAVMRDLDIVAIFHSFGVGLTKKGKSFMGVCPWHDDKTPSLSVDPVKKLYHCFGCGESGDAITLVEKMKGCGFTEALSFLRKSEHSFMKCTTRENEPRIERDAGQEAETKEKRSETIDASMAKADLSVIADYYHKKLLVSEVALSYLKERGLDDTLMLARFGVGYSSDALGSVVGEEQRKSLVALGILNEKGREHFTGCVTFPITDESGNVVGMYGRAIDDRRDTSAGSVQRVKHLYLKGTHQGVFNRKASKVYNEIILTESIIDALSLVKLGFENTQSLYGTNGFTEEHLQILKDDRVKTVVLALDNDEAGRTASEKIREKLLSEGFAVKEIVPPAGKDWNEYLVSGGTTAAVKELLATVGVSAPTPSTDDSMRITKEHLAYICATKDVTYRVSGVKDIFVGSLRVAVKAESAQGRYVDTLDLYSARGRASFSMNLSKISGIESSRIEKDLLTLLEYFEAMRDKALFAGKSEEKAELTEQEKSLGLSLLTDPHIFERIVSDMELLGYVGEDVNKKLLYLAASSRILDDPISVLILSQSSAGKSYLVDTVKKLMPEDEVVSVTSLSDQALNYVEDLMHKFLILGEAVHSDVVEHQIREMLSGKELSRLVAVKDEKTGVIKSQAVKKPVIVSAVMSGTNSAINPENASRCFVITADESREQTRRIHLSQRSKYSLERYAAKEKEMPEIIRIHHAAQRLLKKVRVVNPFAQHLDFPDSLMRTRRDHDRFMDLIACVCFLRQYQKEEHEENGIHFIECDLADYEVAYEIMVKGVLSTTMREMTRGTIEFYEMLRSFAREKSASAKVAVHEASFTQREVREYSGYGQTWVKTHIRFLSEYEYIVLVKGGAERYKGVYRLREDRDIESINLSMIPTPDEMHARYTQSGRSGHHLVSDQISGQNH